MEELTPITLENSCFKVPHGKETLSFYYPDFDGNSGKIAMKMSELGLKPPTPSETVSLVFRAFQTRWKEYEQRIEDILNKNFYWEYTGNLYLPKSNEEISDGIILEQNPKFSHSKEVLPKVTLERWDLVMDKDDLIKRLENNDPLVKFVPFDFKAGLLSHRELEKHPYILARYGEEGVQKLAKIVSDYYDGKALLTVYSTSKGIEANKLGMEKRLCSLGNCWYHKGIMGISEHENMFDYKAFAFGKK